MSAIDDLAAEIDEYRQHVEGIWILHNSMPGDGIRDNLVSQIREYKHRADRFQRLSNIMLQTQTSNAAKYKIVPISEPGSVNQGGNFKINIAISGYGHTFDNKLCIFAPNELVDYEKYNSVAIHQWDTSELNLRIISPESQVDSPNMAVSLPPSFFFYNLDRYDSIGSIGYIRMLLSESRFGLKDSEGGPHSKGAIVASIRVADDVRPGDYKIHMTFTYMDGYDIEQDSTYVTIHVNNWRERYARELVVIAAVGFVATLLTIATTVLPAIPLNFPAIVTLLLIVAISILTILGRL